MWYREPRELLLKVGEAPALLIVDVSRKRADPTLKTAVPAVTEAANQISDLLESAREREMPIFFSRGGKSYYTSGGAALTDTFTLLVQPSTDAVVAISASSLSARIS